jgi:hypothetical protein
MSEFDAATLRFQKAISTAVAEEAAWQALKEYAEAGPGCKLFTVMTVDMQQGLARRTFTSHPEHYPVSGTKPIHQDSWFDIVHGQKRSFVANTIEAIAAVFPDHELIASLGCGSVLNLPVVIKGELVATINMLHEAHHYTPERVAAAEAQLHTPARLCWALAALFDRESKTPD